MSITSYAQNFEDVMLWRALKHIEQGFYIDIGAQDPTIDSVSLAFHEHGWRGIHVEPTPHYAELLRQQRPGDTIIQAAVGNGPAISRFFEIPNTGISTADADIAAQHRERGFKVQEITVTFLPLSAIFDICTGEVHWLKIDVEGFERQLLSSWGESTVRPWILVVESTLPLTQIESHENWESIIIGYEYEPVYFDGLNRYYVSHAHPELKASFAAPPNIFDDFLLDRQNRQAKLELETLQQTHEKELEAQAKFLANKQLDMKTSEEIAAGHGEQERVLHEQISWLQQERVAREQTLHEQTQKTKLETEKILFDNAQREQEVARHLLALQQKAEQDKFDLVRFYGEQERDLDRKYAGQHEALQNMQRELQQQLSWLQQDRLEREKILHEQTIQAKQQTEELLRLQTQRESEIAAQLLSFHLQAEQNKAELIRSHGEQERLLCGQLVEREKEHAEQTRKIFLDLETVRCQQIQREQQIAAQLHGVRQQVEQEKAELEDIHREQARALHNQLVEQGQLFERQLLTRQQELQNRLDWAQKVADKLLVLEQQTKAEAAEQARSHRTQERELSLLQAEREDALRHQLQAEQEKIHHLEEQQTQREQEINAQLLTILQQAKDEQAERVRALQAYAAAEAELQLEIHSRQEACMHLRQLLAQVEHNLEQTHASMSWRMTAPLRRIASFFGASQGQATVPVDLNEAENSDLVKPISPTPVNTSDVDCTGEPNASEKNPVSAAEDSLKQVPADVSELTSFEQTAPTATEKLSVAPAASEPLKSTISQLAHPIAKNMSNNASTLSELLTFHDQHFVRCAYKSLLGRSPDPEGFHYYLDRVRSGFSKTHIVAQLCLSNEGRAYASKLPGLDQALERYKKEKNSIVGMLFRVFGGSEGNSSTERKLRAIENQIFLYDAKSQDRLDQLETAISALHKTIGIRPATTATANSSPQEVMPSTSIAISSEDKISEYPRQLSPRAREFYSHIKNKALNNAQRCL